jgi:hypothetical protein
LVPSSESPKKRHILVTNRDDLRALSEEQEDTLPLLRFDLIQGRTYRTFDEGSGSSQVKRLVHPDFLVAPDAAFAPISTGR